MSLIGSIYFVGFMISSSFVPRIADKYGRKRVLIYNMILQTSASVMILKTTSIYVMIVLFFIIGLCSSGSQTLTTMYINEFAPSKYHNALTTSINSMDASLMIV